MKVEAEVDVTLDDLFENWDGTPESFVIDAFTAARCDIEDVLDAACSYQQDKVIGWVEDRTEIPTLKNFILDDKEFPIKTDIYFVEFIENLVKHRNNFDIITMDRITKLLTEERIL